MLEQSGEQIGRGCWKKIGKDEGGVEEMGKEVGQQVGGSRWGTGWVSERLCFAVFRLLDRRVWIPPLPPESCLFLFDCFNVSQTFHRSGDPPVPPSLAKI